MGVIGTLATGGGLAAALPAFMKWGAVGDFLSSPSVGGAINTANAFGGFNANAPAMPRISPPQGALSQNVDASQWGNRGADGRAVNITLNHYGDNHDQLDRERHDREQAEQLYDKILGL